MPKDTALSEEAIGRHLERLPGWTVAREEATGRTALTRTFTFPSFAAAVGYMHAAVPRIDALDHHPDWSNSFKTVVVSLTTHDAGHRITARDIALAETLMALFEASSP